jgi:beta-glucosidase
VREIGAASTVLLKNTDEALPLKKPRSIVLVGSDAGPGKVGPNEFADQVWSQFLFRIFVFTYRAKGGVDGILAMGWGSGLVFPFLARFLGR